MSSKLSNIAEKTTASFFPLRMALSSTAGGPPSPPSIVAFELESPFVCAPACREGSLSCRVGSREGASKEGRFSIVCLLFWGPDESRSGPARRSFGVGEDASSGRGTASPLVPECARYLRSARVTKSGKSLRKAGEQREEKQSGREEERDKLDNSGSASCREKLISVAFSLDQARDVPGRDPEQGMLNEATVESWGQTKQI